MSQVFSWDLKGLSPADRFFHLARAYLDCSGHLFRSLNDKSLKRTFSHAQSAAFLFEHSVELFLKGAIIQALKRVANTHDLEHLYNEFRNLYPGKKFNFTARIDEVVTKDQARPYAEYSRYPIDTSGKLWPGNSHFDFDIWLKQLELFKKEYERLIPLVKERYSVNSTESET
jgi:HEPN domain-containing protein